MATRKTKKRETEMTSGEYKQTDLLTDPTDWITTTTFEQVKAREEKKAVVCFLPLFCRQKQFTGQF